MIFVAGFKFSELVGSEISKCPNCLSTREHMLSELVDFLLRNEITIFEYYFQHYAIHKIGFIYDINIL